MSGCSCICTLTHFLFSPIATLMTILKRFLYLTVILITFTACGGSDDEDEPITETNSNRNNTAVCKDADRLEFPHLKGGNNVVIVHKTDNNTVVNYAVEWDCDKKSQRWSCYEMSSRYMVANTSRYYGNPQYPLDPDLPLKDYLDRPSEDYIVGDYFWNSGFDHGHICPSADRLYSREANYQTFYLTNMQPQFNTFNAGLWAMMEKQVRTWAAGKGVEALYVCKGGTIDKEENILGYLTLSHTLAKTGKLLVPKYFFMAILLKNAQGYRAIAFWCQNENIDRTYDSLANYTISIDELEKRTGIDFFCNLPDQTEQKVEQSYAASVWGLR